MYTHEYLPKIVDRSFVPVVANYCGPSGFSSSLWGGTQLHSPILQGSASKPARWQKIAWNCKIWSTTREQWSLVWQIGRLAQLGGLWRPLEKKFRTWKTRMMWWLGAKKLPGAIGQACWLRPTLLAQEELLVVWALQRSAEWSAWLLLDCRRLRWRLRLCSYP